MLSALNITKPGCQRKCGNLTIPYPFGVGRGCSRSMWYDISCNASTNGDPPRAITTWVKDENENGMEILDISETHIRLRNQVAYSCFNSTAETSTFGSGFKSFDLFNSSVPFTLSSESNMLFIVGCHDLGYFDGNFDFRGSVFINSADQTGSCRTDCSFEAKNVVAGECDGIGCCQAIINKGMKSYTVSLDPSANHTSFFSYNPCGYAFLADKEQFKFRGALDLHDPNFINRIIDEVPMVLDWVIDNHTCSLAQQDPASYACDQQNTICVDAAESGIGGYRCSCRPGYQGNPYLTPGCSGIPFTSLNFLNS